MKRYLGVHSPTGYRPTRGERIVDAVLSFLDTAVASAIAGAVGGAVGALLVLVIAEVAL